jgi:hypothetical protein
MMVDKIITISVSSDNAADTQAMLDHIRTFPGYATDNARVMEDTRRGGFTVRYASAVIHSDK